jgi:ribosomal protein S21
LSVQVHNNNIESAIRLFRRKIDDAGIMDTIRNGRYYEKPSIIRREKKKEQSFKHQIKRKQEEDSQVSHNRSKRRRKK